MKLTKEQLEALKAWVQCEIEAGIEDHIDTQHAHEIDEDYPTDMDRMRANMNWELVKDMFSESERQEEGGAHDQE